MAVWRPSKGISLRIILILTSVAMSVSATPIKPISASSDPWWYSPCISPVRHSRSTSPERLGWDLNIFETTIKNTINQTKNLYKNKGSKHGPSYPHLKYRWLKIKRHIKEMKNDTSNALTEFFKVLQIFAGALQDLSQIKVETGARFNREGRNSIYINFTNNLRGLICGVQETLINDRKEAPRVPKKKLHIPRDLDYTNVHVLDINFFTKLRSFFRRARPILEKKYRRKRKKNQLNGGVKSVTNKVKKGPK